MGRLVCFIFGSMVILAAGPWVCAEGIGDIRKVYAAHCAECHEPTGRGTEYRISGVRIPDFTDPKWLSTRSATQLRLSILQGKGDDMPPFQDELSKAEADSLVTLIQSFAATKPVVVVTKSKFEKDVSRYLSRWSGLKGEWDYAYTRLSSLQVNRRNSRQE